MLNIIMLQHFTPRKENMGAVRGGRTRKINSNDIFFLIIPPLRLFYFPNSNNCYQILHPRKIGAP